MNSYFAQKLLRKAKLARGCKNVAPNPERFSIGACVLISRHFLAINVSLGFKLNNPALEQVTLCRLTTKLLRRYCVQIPVDSLLNPIKRRRVLP